jgi:hypothetical protein
MFGGHQISRFTDWSGTVTYYDPSYGVTYSNLNEFKAKLAGIFKIVRQDIPEATYHLDIDGDGAQDGVVGMDVVRIAKNLGQFEIVETVWPW